MTYFTKKMKSLATVSTLALALFGFGTAQAQPIFQWGVNSQVEQTDRALSEANVQIKFDGICLLYTSPSPRDGLLSRMPSSA